MAIITRHGGEQEETGELTYDRLKHLEKIYEDILDKKWNIDEAGIERVTKNLKHVRAEIELR